MRHWVSLGLRLRLTWEQNRTGRLQRRVYFHFLYAPPKKVLFSSRGLSVGYADELDRALGSLRYIHVLVLVLVLVGHASEWVGWCVSE